MESLNKATFRTYDAKDALPEMFPKVGQIYYKVFMLPTVCLKFRYIFLYSACI